MKLKMWGRYHPWLTPRHFREHQNDKPAVEQSPEIAKVAEQYQNLPVGMIGICLPEGIKA